jgi:heparan-alpha-glucosaminide N-acetyltransferase
MTLAAAPEAETERELAPRVTATNAPTREAPSGRLTSIDAYRGLVMVLMISAGLQIPEVVNNFRRIPGLQHLESPIWDRLAFHTDHVAWVGCGLWDLIQPSFMFLVGTALAFSIASRRAKGQSFRRMFGHAVVRSIVLVLLGVFLASNWSRHTNWVFTNVLSQIGLGYTFLFLLAWAKPRWQLAAVLGILLLYWGAFALYPARAAGDSSTSLGLPEGWTRLEGFAAHWEKNANFAAHVDHGLLNLFPRDDGKPYTFNKGGYTTLNFVPSLATMLLGLLAGELIRSRLSSTHKLTILLLSGLGGLAIGWGLGRFGVCPVIKRIWTPSWTIYSAGWAFLTLALFYLVIDVARLKRWAFPLVVVGMNSIAAYCIAQLLGPWVRETVRRHLGEGFYGSLGRAVYAGRGILKEPLGAAGTDAYAKAFTPMAEATVFLLFCWLVCFWMHRRKIFIKI